MQKKEKKVISEQLHKTLLILFVGITIAMLLVKTFFF